MGESEGEVSVAAMTCHAICLAALVLILSIVPARADEVFVHETVDTTGITGFETSIDLDVEGQPRISYQSATIGGLKYARKLDGAWLIETVDANGSQNGRYTSIAIDGLGDTRISYYGGNTFDGDLKYASRVGGTWVIETVESVGDVGYWTSLVLDGQDNPRISYGDGTTDDLKYATKSLGTWSIETVDSAGFVGDFSSLALDRGNPCISYRAVLTWDLKYASKSGGVWSVGIVDSTGDVGSFTSLALDAQGNPCIGYQERPPNWDLKYASKSGGSWTLETVDGPGSVGTFISLELDEQDNPHIGYYDETANVIKYARKLDGSWLIEVVAFDSYDLSLALDQQGRPHFSYFYLASRDLKYAVSLGATDVPPGAYRETLLSVAPSPMTEARTSIQYRVPSGGLTDLSIFDVTGRRISTLVRGGHSSPGEGTISWNGLDDTGRSVATGTYLLRLTAGTKSETCRITLVR